MLALLRAGGVAFWLALLPLGLLAQDLQPIPALTAHVLDATGTLDAAQKAALEARLAALEKSKGSQVVVLMVPSTAPEDIASYANRVANAWKIGRKGVGDGLLLVVAKNDRKLRIEVAKTLEGAIPDLAAKRIIDEAITPAFRAGDYSAGLEAGVERIVGLINGEPLPPPPADSGKSRGGEGFQWMDLAIFLFFAVPVFGSIATRLMGRKVGSLLSGGVAGLVALFFTSSLVIAGIAGVVAVLFLLLSGFKGIPMTGGTGGWGAGRGSWGGGGGGGGFSSGGGGDFGGGGASGDW
ncbi:MAG: TPM domain-containing protein [Burkholderiaceae bacterium]|nr:TPM domain-containing protein [Burkholderiaceae bacterium]MDO9088859.1 TPM domain-containing protein [Burkholderiaceae bacterium]